MSNDPSPSLHGDVALIELQPSQRVDPAGRLEDDLACRNCDYNLRGQPTSGVCPECGTPVSRSTASNILHFCHPAWVQTLASSMNWMIAAFVCGVLSYLMQRALLFGGPWRILYAIPTVLFTVGMWKFTSLDSTANRRRQAKRKLVRVAAAITMLDMLVLIGLESAGVTQIAQIPFVFWDGIIDIICLYALGAYANSLAVRIPNESIARQTNILKWAVFITRLCCIATAVTTILVSRLAPKSDVMFTLLSILGYLTIPGCLFRLWAAILFFRYRRAFRDAAALSRATWEYAAARPSTPAA